MRTLLLVALMLVSSAGCVDDVQAPAEDPAKVQEREKCLAACSPCYMVSLGSYSSGCLCRDDCRRR